MVTKNEDHIKYNERYDAMYDEEKDVWLEGKCCDEPGSVYCHFCSDRPEKPSQAKEG